MDRTTRTSLIPPLVREGRSSQPPSRTILAANKIECVCFSRVVGPVLHGCIPLSLRDLSDDEDLLEVKRRDGAHEGQGLWDVGVHLDESFGRTHSSACLFSRSVLKRIEASIFHATSERMFVVLQSKSQLARRVLRGALHQQFRQSTHHPANRFRVRRWDILHEIPRVLRSLLLHYGLRGRSYRTKRRTETIAVEVLILLGRKLHQILLYQQKYPRNLQRSHGELHLLRLRGPR